MPIHHATLKKAQSLGIILSEKGDSFEAHWPKRNQRLTGDNAGILVTEMGALIDCVSNYRTFKFKIEPDEQRTVWTMLGGEKASATDSYFHRAFETVKKMWTDYRSELDEEELEAEQEQEDAAEGEDLGGSVVAPKYRLLYAEKGHPTHCGDWLATTLNNLCLNDGGTNVELFAAICAANGIDMAKYDRVAHGWQGRFRMTGRNMLSRRVFLAGGVLQVPGTDPLQAPAEWMDLQRYRSKKASENLAKATQKIEATVPPDADTEVVDRFGVNPPGLPVIEPKGPRKGSKRKMAV